MKTLLLSPYPAALAAAVGDTVVVWNEPIRPDQVIGYDFLISFGYRHIIKPDVLAIFGRRALNLHISALPWNKGAHPNVWSWIEGTPKGVTLHVMTPGLDLGPIVAQEIIPLDPSDTLAKTHATLLRAAEAMFARNWPVIKTGRFESFEQLSGGSFHRARELPDSFRNFDMIEAGECEPIIVGDVFKA